MTRQPREERDNSSSTTSRGRLFPTSKQQQTTTTTTACRAPSPSSPPNHGVHSTLFGLRSTADNGANFCSLKPVPQIKSFFLGRHLMRSSSDVQRLTGAACSSLLPSSVYRGKQQGRRAAPRVQKRDPGEGWTACLFDSSVEQTRHCTCHSSKTKGRKKVQSNPGVQMPGTS